VAWQSRFGDEIDKAIPRKKIGELVARRSLLLLPFDG